MEYSKLPQLWQLMAAMVFIPSFGVIDIIEEKWLIGGLFYCVGTAGGEIMFHIFQKFKYSGRKR
jgi:hypothetical protein